MNNIVINIIRRCVTIFDVINQFPDNSSAPVRGRCACVGRRSARGRRADRPVLSVAAETACVVSRETACPALLVASQRLCCRGAAVCDYCKLPPAEISGSDFRSTGSGAIVTFRGLMCSEQPAYSFLRQYCRDQVRVGARALSGHGWQGQFGTSGGLQGSTTAAAVS